MGAQDHAMVMGGYLNRRCFCKSCYFSLQDCDGGSCHRAVWGMAVGDERPPLRGRRLVEAVGFYGSSLT